MIIDTEEWVSIAKFAKIVDKSPQLVTHYVKSGRIRAMRIGRDWLVHLSALKGWPPRIKLGRPKQQPEE